VTLLPTLLELSGTYSREVPDPQALKIDGVETGR
jgi:hypothetical protein